MTREEGKEQLRIAATEILKDRNHSNAAYLRTVLRKHYRLYLSVSCLRVWMQELADAGHFKRSDFPYGGTGYRWMLP